MEYIIIGLVFAVIAPIAAVQAYNAGVRRAKAKAERKVVSGHMVGRAMDIRVPDHVQIESRYVDSVLQQRILSQPVKKKVQQNEAQGNYLVFAELERLERKLKQARSLSEKATLTLAKHALEATLKK